MFLQPMELKMLILKANNPFKTIKWVKQMTSGTKHINHLRP